MWSVWQSRKSRPVSHDPWDAPGLEWSISSPPPAYNFAEIPRIEGRDQYWITKQRAEEAGTPIRGPEAPVDPRSIHMPSPSYWPIITAAGVALIGGGILVHYGLSFAGGLITMIGIIGWSNEPAAAPQEHN